MRVLPGVILSLCGEPPGPIFTGNPMRQMLLGEPIEDPVEGHAIHGPLPLQALFHFRVGKRALCFKEAGQHDNPVACNPTSSGPQQGFGAAIPVLILHLSTQLPAGLTASQHAQ